MRRPTAALVLALCTTPALAQESEPEAPSAPAETSPAPAPPPAPKTEPAPTTPPPPVEPVKEAAASSPTEQEVPAAAAEVEPATPAEPDATEAKAAPAPAPAQPPTPKKRPPPVEPAVTAPTRPTTTAPAPAPAPAPEPRRPSTAAQTSSTRTEDRVALAARDFFRQLLAGDARSISARAGIPFQLESNRYLDQKALFEAWLKALRNKRTDLLVLHGIQVLSPEDMQKKYGMPPARLQSLPWRAPKTWIAVGNLSGRAAIAVFKEAGEGDFQLVGYTD